MQIVETWYRWLMTDATNFDPVQEMNGRIWIGQFVPKDASHLSSEGYPQTSVPLSPAVRVSSHQSLIGVFCLRSVYLEERKKKVWVNKLKSTRIISKGLRWRKTKRNSAMETQTRPKPPCSKNLLMRSTIFSRAASHLVSSPSNFSGSPPSKSRV